ncbi:hypothetical protein H2O64_00155 [Kordia sp. YSTF-M3]|uniref:Natural product n=1 Tax=Kordia aestuariivivens TaxID=2759037 RepID=A0ABR7Q3C7_9FLAO|nr:hypothetical protein [Kordia aestuariivivens]MBC8753061.1 hypothetical protein [Kordia aestuariivivens]
MKKKKIDLHKLMLHKTRISNFNISGGNAETSVSFFVACPIPQPASLTCKPTTSCDSWRHTQCDRTVCATNN